MHVSLHAVDDRRLAYMMDTLDTHHGLPHKVRREHVFEDCIELYTKNLDAVFKEFPFRIRYANEKAIDTGGVSRDMFCAFWDDTYMAAFDGGNLLCILAQIWPNYLHLGPYCRMDFSLAAFFLFGWHFLSLLLPC